MTTCTITGTLKNSAGTLLEGELWLQLDAPLVDSDTTPDSVYPEGLAKIPITAGAVSLTLAESATSNITYWFRFYEEDLTQDSGLAVQPALDFHAIVPNQATCEFSQLLPTGISRDALDSSIVRLALELTSVDQYRNALRGGPQFLGDWDSAIFYSYGQAVNYAGTTWVYVADDPSANIIPSVSTSTYWQAIGLKGDPGGTDGQDTPYDATGWNGAQWAPTANAIRDLVEGTLVKQSALTGLAPILNPAFTGTPTVVTAVPYPDSSARLASTAWVTTNFAPLASPTFTGNPAAPTQGLSDNSNKLATTSWVRQYFAQQQFGVVVLATQTNALGLTSGSYTVVPFNNEQVDLYGQFNPTTGAFTPTTAGYYRVQANLTVTAATSLTNFEIALLQAGTRVGSMGFLPANSFGSTLAACGVFYLNAGTAYTVGVLPTGTGAISLFLSATTVNSLSIERVF